MFQVNRHKIVSQTGIFILLKILTIWYGKFFHFLNNILILKSQSDEMVEDEGLLPPCSVTQESFFVKKTWTLPAHIIFVLWATELFQTIPSSIIR